MRHPMLLAGLASLTIARVAYADDDSPPTRAQLRKLEDENAELRARIERLEALTRPAPPTPPPVAPAPPPATPPPPSVLSSSVLQPTILAEADFRAYPSEAEGNTGFALARFRPGLILAPARWFRGVITLEFAHLSEGPSILDAFARLRATDWLEITLGYSKPPMFPSFVYEPVHTLSFPDQPAVVNAFAVARDVGADAHVAPRSVPLEGWVRVGNGTGSPLGNDNPLPAAYAALDVVAGRAWIGARPESRTFGLRIGAAGVVEDARDRDGILGHTPLGFIYFRPVVVSGVRGVGEAHAIVYGGPLRLVVEGAMARESRSRDDDGNPSTARAPLQAVDSFGVSAELSCVLVGLPREVGAAPRARPKADGAWSGGALEVAARYDGMWLARGATDVRPGGSQGGALALKWWPTPFAATTLSGYLMRYDTAPIEEPDTRVSWGLILRASFFLGSPSEPQRPPPPPR